MIPTSQSFKANAHEALQDTYLQKALDNMRAGFPAKRLDAISRLPEFEDLRDQAKDIKDHTLAHLDWYLERYERNVVASGGHVHWARTAGEARDIVLQICRRLGARSVTKGKSMIAEEQTALDPKRAVAEPRSLVAEARQILREKFLAADVGVTGANFLIAETGTSVIVTNEGNGDLTQLLPKAHIVLASLEKIVPTLEDAAAIIRVLARSATGQDMSVYTTFSTGPRRPDDLDGPGEYHLVLLDNGRSALPRT